MCQCTCIWTWICIALLFRLPCNTIISDFNNTMDRCSKSVFTTVYIKMKLQTSKNHITYPPRDTDQSTWWVYGCFIVSFHLFLNEKLRMCFFFHWCMDTTTFSMSVTQGNSNALTTYLFLRKCGAFWIPPPIKLQNYQT